MDFDFERDSFLIEIRKLPDNLGFNDDGKGLFLNGTFNVSNPNPDWKWNVTTDSISMIPIQTFPANIIH